MLGALLLVLPDSKLRGKVLRCSDILFSTLEHVQVPLVAGVSSSASPGCLCHENCVYLLQVSMWGGVL